MWLRKSNIKHKWKVSSSGVLLTIPRRSTEVQHGIEVSIQGHIVRHILRVFEAESEESIRKMDAPGPEDLVGQGFMEI